MSAVGQSTGSAERPNWARSRLLAFEQRACMQGDRSRLRRCGRCALKDRTAGSARSRIPRCPWLRLQSSLRRPPTRCLRLIRVAEHALDGARFDHGMVVIRGLGQMVDLVALAQDVALDRAGGLYRRRRGYRGFSISGLVSTPQARLARLQSDGESKVPAQSPRFSALAVVSPPT